MINFRLFLLLLLLLWPVCSPGRDDRPQPVAPVLRPAARMHWIITITPGPTREGKSPPPGTAPRARKVETLRIGDTERVRITPVNGSPFERWKVGCTFLGKSLVTGRARAFQVPPEEEAYPYASGGFYGIEHVRLEDDQGEAELAGKRYRYFRGGSSGADGKGPMRRAYQAWFDPETGLPVFYREGNTTFSFEFRRAPEGNLALPAELEQAWREHRQNLKRLGQ